MNGNRKCTCKSQYKGTVTMKIVRLAVKNSDMSVVPVMEFLYSRTLMA